MGIGCRIYRELNYALAGEVGACETQIHIHSESVYGVCGKRIKTQLPLQN